MIFRYLICTLLTYVAVTLVHVHKLVHLWHRRKVEYILFNNALLTHYLWLCVIRHMVRDHSDSDRRNLLQPLHVLFLISSKRYFICTIAHKERIYHSLCYTSCGALACMTKSTMAHHEGLICTVTVTLPINYVTNLFINI